MFIAYSAAKLLFASRLPKPKHLRRHHLADLFLDTRYYNAHTTASDALWAGLPVLTLKGPTITSSVAAGLLHASQTEAMSLLITHDLAEYVSVATRLGRSPSLTLQLHRTIRDRILQKPRAAPLFNSSRFAGSLEKAYECMWELQQTRPTKSALLNCISSEHNNSIL